MNTEEELFVIVAGAAGAGAGEEDEAEKSKRSFIAEEDAGAAAGLDEVKSPKPPKLLCAGFGDEAAGLVSKKLPPLRPENAEEDWGGGDLLLDMPPRPEKAEGDDVGGLLELEMLAKLRLLKASFKEDCCCGCGAAGAVGECIEPNELEWECEGCCCACCGRGAVA